MSGSVGKIFLTRSGKKSGASGNQYTYLAPSSPRSLPYRTEQERLEWIKYDEEVETRKKVLLSFISQDWTQNDWRVGLESIAPMHLFFAIEYARRC